VGIIVIGVLLALGAQQLAEEIQIRSDLRTFRQTIDHEIALNLYTYDVRVRQSRCVNDHLRELKKWLDQARGGQTVPPLSGRGVPLTLSPYRSAWDNRNAAIYAHLPENVRAKYAEFYDELANNYRLIDDEIETWRMLDPYVEPGPISLQDRRLIRSTLMRADGFNYTMDQNVEVSRRIARQLRVRSAAPDGVAADIEPLIARCAQVVADH
jgi:hypothetical protein